MNCDIDIKNAIEVMRKGGVILYPTDTIWGIGCDAQNEEAVRRVYEIKRREDSKALICLVDSANRMQRYFRNVPEVAWDLIDYAERPLTLILDGAVNVAPNLLADDGSLGIRVTKEQFSQQLCYRFQRAIVSTSANFSGEPSPKSFYDIPEELKSQVDYIVQFARGRKSDGRPSSIIKLAEDGTVTVIRQ
ncbi:MAG: threonylcarbamoyl-AMP synthase [Bacteroidaceae bacterium]|nr:threonylcarbamoyl-AMP synthase [Bacteroidaceae bacterium]MBR1788697.1 threonylcarbamoyl-AMP synthase [Bacteroidaceae bacterium]